ncbi:unnamed protein product [Paramecium sonneborni]|uniref:Uncharacterized protein n=1 Tax=Paramecium sonneborni TaxID=65129 RepID=A0A8S1QSQ2_9CILI|nr:unnamed protein product [Paramecium sonneborni]
MKIQEERIDQEEYEILIRNLLMIGIEEGKYVFEGVWIVFSLICKCFWFSLGQYLPIYSSFFNYQSIGYPRK